VRRVQLPQDKLGATANRSAANIRITIVSLAMLMSWLLNVFGARFSIANYLFDGMMLAEQVARTQHYHDL
jgi:hypothetical protein